MRPLPVDHGGEHEVRAEVPQFGAGGNGANRRACDGEVWVVDEQRAADHGRKHDGPVGERLVGQVRKDDLGRHASEDEGHRQAVEYQVVVLEDERIGRAEPGDGRHAEDDQRSPFQEDREDWKVLGPSCACDIDEATRHVGDKEGEQYHGYPDVSEAHLAQLLSVTREVLDERGGPDLGSEEAGHADECACNDETLCGQSVNALVWER